MAQTIRQFWRSLSKLINVGFSLNRSLDLILKNFPPGIFYDDLKQIITGVNSGLSLAEALSKHPIFFSLTEINLVRASDNTGMLEVSLHYLVNGSLPTRADEYRNFYTVLGTCLTCGVPTLVALAMAKQYCTTELKDAVDIICQKIKNGNSLAYSMEQTKLFSKEDIFFVNLGEETGTTNQELLNLAKLC